MDSPQLGTTAPPPLRRALIEAIIASTVGTTIEWYDFFLSGTAAVLVFPYIFFSQDLPPFYSQLLAFGAFAAGFISRPLGGVLFGYLGDRVGRKSTLVATLLLMGVSTILIGSLPSYGQIGIAAPLLLTLLRFIQGLGVGGEWGGAVLLALEYGHHGKRGFYASWPQAGVPLGLLASTGVMTLFQHNLTREEFLAWGWRVPFFLSALLILVGLLIRFRILETPLFQQLRERNQISEAPVREAVSRHGREILLAAGSRIGENASFYVFTIYIVAYSKQVLELSEGLALTAVNLAAVGEFFTIPLFGMLADYWSRKRCYIVGCLLLFVFAFPYYALLETREPLLIILATVVMLAFCHALLYSVQASLIPELFGTRLRYSGASIGYQLGAPLAGGLAPIIAASLVQAFPGHYWPLAGYLMVIAMISLACVMLLAETSQKNLAE